MPTSIEKIIIPIIEKYSERKLNEGFGVCYVPDFVALGNTIHDFQNPDFVLIGETNSRSGTITEMIYSKMCLNEAPIIRMSIINAEIAKIALNNFITMKISFANALGNLCEQIPGANSDTISKAIGHDRRISPKYLRCGLAFGGTCFPRDVEAWLSLSKRYKNDNCLFQAVKDTNEYQNDHLFEIVKEQIKKVKTNHISILGLSFKPETPVIEKSPAIELIRKLLKDKIIITVYDKYAINNTKKLFGNKINYVVSAYSCIKASPVCVFTTPDNEFRSISTEKIGLKKKILIDCWRILPKNILTKKITHISFGVGK